MAEVRLIDENVLLADKGNYVSSIWGNAITVMDIDQAPTIDAEPVRHGLWIEIGADKHGRGGIQKCTACDGTYPYRCKYCPNCGAKMYAKEEDHA